MISLCIVKICSVFSDTEDVGLLDKAHITGKIKVVKLSYFNGNKGVHEFTKIVIYILKDKGKFSFPLSYCI